MSNKIVLKENEQVLKLSEEEEKFIVRLLRDIVTSLKEKNFVIIKDLVEASLNKLPQRPLGEGHPKLSDVYFLYASALKELNDDNSKVLQYATLAFQFNRLNKNSLWLIREVNNDLSDKTRLFRFQVIGKLYRMHKNEEITDPFKTIYTIAADNEEEAFNFIKKYDRQEVTQEIEIFKTFILGKRPELPKGIYEAMKLIQWFDEKDIN